LSAFAHEQCESNIGLVRWPALCRKIYFDGMSEVMRVNEVAKDRSCTAIEKDPLHLLLEIERRFRAEERKNLCSQIMWAHSHLM